MNSPGYLNEDRRPEGRSATGAEPVISAPDTQDSAQLSNLRMPSLTAEGTKIDEHSPKNYGIPAEQRQAFSSLLETLAAFQSPRPLMLRTVSERPELTALLETTRALASECAGSMAENRANAVRFVDVLRDFLRESPQAGKSLKAPLARCSPALESAIDSKVLELKPLGGVDVAEQIGHTIQTCGLCTLFMAVGVITQNMPNPLTTVGWLGAAGFGTSIAMCVFRRSLASIVRGGFKELKYTKAILNLRACLKETDR